MNSNCIITNCIQGCCNIDGICPTDTGTFNQQNCYYFYDYGFWLWYTWWIWLVIAVASTLFLTCIVCCVVACVRGSRAKNQDLIIVTDQQYGQQYSNYNNQYEMSQGRPTQTGGAYLGQPVYQNGQNAPFTSNTPNIYQ